MLIIMAKQFCFLFIWPEKTASKKKLGFHSGDQLKPLVWFYYASVEIGASWEPL